MSIGTINTFPNNDFIADTAKILSILDNGGLGVSGQSTSWNVVREGVADYTIAKLSGFNEFLLSDQSQINGSNFVVNGDGEYEIPANTTIKQSAVNIVWDRPLRLLGNFAYKGTINGSQVAKAISLQDGSFIRSINCKFLHIEEMQFLPFSLAQPIPAPNEEATLFEIDQDSAIPPDPSLWTDNCFLWKVIPAGFGDIGTIGSFDFLYLDSVSCVANLEGFKFQNIKVMDLLSFIWQSGLGAGTVLTTENIQEFLANNLILRCNPSEFPFNFIDNSFFERGKLIGGMYRNELAPTAPVNPFKSGSLTTSSPKIVIDGFDPIARSGVSAEYSIIGAESGVTESPAAIDNYYPFTNQLIVNSEERLELAGTGANTRILYKGNEQRRAKISLTCSLEGSTGSVVLKVGIGVWAGTDIIGDDPILTSDTIRYNFVDAKSMPVNAVSFTTVVASKTLILNPGDYIKIYFSSSNTSNISLQKVSVDIIEA